MTIWREFAILLQYGLSRFCLFLCFRIPGYFPQLKKLERDIYTETGYRDDISPWCDKVVRFTQGTWRFFDVALCLLLQITALRHGASASGAPSSI